jgi:hypothetical protein
MVAGTYTVPWIELGDWAGTGAASADATVQGDGRYYKFTGSASKAFFFFNASNYLGSTQYGA